MTREVHTYELAGQTIYHIYNFLDQETFADIQKQKKILYKGYSFGTVFHKVNDYKNIDNWEPAIGSALLKYAKTVKEFFDSHNLNVRLMDAHVSKITAYHWPLWQSVKHRPWPIWHKHHPFPPTNDINKFWVAVFYHHPFWDDEYTEKYDGRLRVSTSAEDPGIKLPCYANSVVIHNNQFGHTADNIIFSFPNDREVCYTDWRVF